jgi:hypothetical protein
MSPYGLRPHLCCTTHSKTSEELNPALLTPGHESRTLTFQDEAEPEVRSIEGNKH